MTKKKKVPKKKASTRSKAKVTKKTSKKRVAKKTAPKKSISVGITPVAIAEDIPLPPPSKNIFGVPDVTDEEDDTGELSDLVTPVEDVLEIANLDDGPFEDENDPNNFPDDTCTDEDLEALGHPPAPKTIPPEAPSGTRKKTKGLDTALKEMLEPDPFFAPIQLLDEYLSSIISNAQTFKNISERKSMLSPLKIVAPKIAQVGGVVVVQRPVAVSAPVGIKVKAKRNIAEDDYRKLRKYTTSSLQPFIAETHVPVLRTQIGSRHTGPLLATELIDFLKTQEDQKKPVREAPADGSPKRRGRPSKAEIAARSNGVVPVANPAAVLARASNGALMAPKAPVAAPVAPKPLFKLPKLAG